MVDLEDPRPAFKEYKFPGRRLHADGDAVQRFEGALRDSRRRQAVQGHQGADEGPRQNYSRARACSPISPFLMPIEDVFSISGRGTVVTGRIEAWHRANPVTRLKSWVSTIHSEDDCHGCGDVPQDYWMRVIAGDNVGCLLRGTGKRDEVERGQVLAVSRARSLLTPSLKPTAYYVLTKEEGGRHTPFFNNYRPQFYFRTTDVTGAPLCCPKVRKW